MAKYDVYIEFEPIYVKEVEANSPEEAEEIVIENAKYTVQLSEVLDSE